MRTAGMFAPPGRAITHVKGDVYRANNGGWYVGILDTPDGLLLVDTLSVDFAKWLKIELAKKFPGKQVKYVILSHSHWDHTEGGKVFADTAKFIAQEGFLRNMDGRFPALPGDIVDRKGELLATTVQGKSLAEHPDFATRDVSSVRRTSMPDFVPEDRRPPAIRCPTRPRRPTDLLGRVQRLDRKCLYEVVVITRLQPRQYVLIRDEVKRVRVRLQPRRQQKRRVMQVFDRFTVGIVIKALAKSAQLIFLRWRKRGRL